MKITKRQLRKLIEESFIGAPDGKVYTQRTKKVPSPYYFNRPDQPEDQVLMDAPVVYGQDRTKVATPRLYGVLTYNWHEIHRFHEKGPEVYKILMDPKTDPETKIQFLSLLLPYGIITDKELQDIQLELDLLISPDFAEYRRLGAERLKNIHDEEALDYTSDREKLYKNPQYVEWAKKQIDKAVDGGFEYFKDAVQEEFFRHMDKQKKGFRTDYEPDEGVDPGYFASEYLNQIGALLGSYKGFRSTEDAAYYNTELDDYTDDKSHDMILVVIDALVDAGILEELDDGKVRMPEATYQIIRNNMRGRAEDYRKKQFAPGTYTTLDPQEPNPNLPVLTREGNKKLTRRQLRKLITETMITPSTEIIRQILDDPEVDEGFKMLLSGDTEEDIAQTLNLLATIYPDKYGDIDIEISADTATTEYEEDFTRIQGEYRDRLLEEFKSWLEENLDSFLGILYAPSVAHYFVSAEYMGLPNAAHEDHLEEDMSSFELPSGRHQLHHTVVKEFVKTLNLTRKNPYIMSDVYDMFELLVEDGMVDLEAGIEAAIEYLKVTGALYVHDYYNYLYVFEDPEGWLNDNGYSELI